MITPAYGPTATERVLPKLALDFTTASLDPRVTVTRALNTATRVNSSGYIEGVNANLPRFDYDPVTLACKGLLIEEARTNLLTYSAQFDNAAWTTASATITANAITAPDGTATAEKIVVSASVSGGNTRQVLTPTAASHSLTLFAKAGEWSWVRIGWSSAAVSFNIANGTVGTVGSGYTASISPAGNGWYRCSVVTALAAAEGSYRIYPTNADNAFSTGDGTSGIYVWGAQAEAGAFATSYIPTTTTSLTRNADIVEMTGTNFSSWFSAAEGSFSAQYDRIGVKRYSRVFAASNVSESEQITVGSGLQADGRENGNIAVASVNNILYPANTPAANLVTRFCLSYKTGSSAASMNASSVATSAAAFANPAPTQLNIGSIVTSGQYLNGHVQNLLYWPQDLTDPEVQTFAKVG